MQSESTDEHADHNIANPMEGMRVDKEPEVLKGTTDKQQDHSELEPAKPVDSEKPVDIENPDETLLEKKEASPKIKIGTGKAKKAKHSKKTEDSESDTPRYSMRIRPTPKRISTGGRSLRTQRVVNYQELYDYRTGHVKPTRDMQKPKDETTPVPSTPSAARLVAHAASKNPNALKGATLKQTILVLVLRPTKADDSDDTVVYEDEDTEQPTPGEPDDPKDNHKDGGTGTQEPVSTDSGNPKMGNKKRALRLTISVIHRPKKQKPKV